MKNKKILLLFLTILFFGFGLRAQETTSGNFIFLIDQGRDMMAVKNIIYDHHLTLIGPYTSLQGVFQGPLWYYLLSLPTFVFNGNPLGPMLMMLIVSMLVLLVAYSWVKKLFGSTAAIFTLLLFVVSPEAIAAATYIWNPHPMWLLIPVYFLSLYSVFCLKKSNFHLILWPVVALMFHFQTALAAFVFLATFVYLILFGRESFRQRKFFYGLGLALIFFLPQILFDIRHNFLMTKSVINIFSGHDQGLFVKGENRNYFDLIKGNISLFYYNFGTSFVRDGHLKNLPLFALIVIFACSILQRRARFFPKKEWSFVSLSLVIIAITAVLSFTYPFPLRYWFLTGFQSVYLIIFGIILSLFWRWIIGKILILFFVTILLFYSGQKLYYLYLNPPDEGGVAKIKGKEKAIDFIYRDAKGKPFGLLIFTPPVYTYAYDYLIWWQGKHKYNYIPYSEKKGTFYLLIEPDSSKPWSYKGWLETVIKTGTILETKELPSGFIIQKRYEKT